MTRKEAIEALGRAMTAEAALTVHIRNIISTFAWSGLPEARRQQVVAALEAMSAVPARRAQRIKSMLERLKGSEQDVF